MRQHTIQAEKTLLNLGRSPNEVQRLLRHIFNAQAEAESALMGMEIPPPAELSQAVEEIYRYTQAVRACIKE